MKRKLLVNLIAIGLLLFVSVVTTRSQPLRTQRFTTQINGATIAYTITGRGTNVVLIHGYPLNGDLFERQRQILGRLFRVITIDLRGFGRSIAPDDQASIDIYASDVLALLDQINVQQAVIGGHSMGGAITLRLYQRAPNRFNGMILNDAVFMPPPTTEQFMWCGFQQQARESGAASFVPILLPDFVTGRNRNEKPDVVAAVTNQISAASINGLIGGAKALETRPDLRPVLPTIVVPTLILFGEEDSLTPMETARMLNAMIPNSELNIVRGATHGLIREDADTSNAVILRWLYRNFVVNNNFQYVEPENLNERLVTSQK